MIYRILTFLSAVALISACNKPPKSAQDYGKESVAAGTKVGIFGKTIIYQYNPTYLKRCNMQSFEKALDKNGACTSVKLIEQEPNKFKITSSDGKINIEGTLNADRTQATVGATVYNCYATDYSVDDSTVLSPTGLSVASMPHVILSTKVATKPSDLDPTSVLIVGYSDDNCEFIK